MATKPPTSLQSPRIQTTNPKWTAHRFHPAFARLFFIPKIPTQPFRKCAVSLPTKILETARILRNNDWNMSRSGLPRISPIYSRSKVLIPEVCEKSSWAVKPLSIPGLRIGNCAPRGSEHLRKLPHYWFNINIGPGMLSGILGTSLRHLSHIAVDH